MKPTAQKQITLDEIAHALDTNSLADARALLADYTGAQLVVQGTLLKTAKRDGLRLVIKADAGKRSFEIYANFSDEAERQKILDAKIKKNSAVVVTGKFASFGSHAVVMSGCSLKQ